MEIPQFCRKSAAVGLIICAYWILWDWEETWMCMHTYIHMYVRTYKHTYIHMYIYIHIYGGKSESKVPYFIATKYLHVVRWLFIHLLHFTSLIFPHSHLLCWSTCLGGKFISQNPVDRKWDPDHAATFAPHAWHHHVIWIAWHAWVVGWVLKNFRAPSLQKIRCCMSCMRSGIVMQQQHPLVGHWAMKVLPSSDQCLNFKWTKRHLTMWSYLVAIK